MFWDRFYSLCIENKTNPTNVVKAIGISHGATTKWKNGTNPNGDVLIKISDYFDVSVDYLVGKTDIKNKTAPSGQPLSPERQLLFDTINNLDEDKVHLAIRILRSILDESE